MTVETMILPFMTKDSQPKPISERHRRIRMTFGERLKRAREAKYDSAEKFAHLLKMEPHTYRKYERGQSEPNFETLTRICGLLEITPNDLLPDASGDKKRRPRSPSSQRQDAA